VRTYVEASEAAAGRPMDDTELPVLDRFEEVTKRPDLFPGATSANCARMASLVHSVPR